MNRAQAADALARSTAFWSSLHAEAEGEATAAREEAVQLRHALAQRTAEVEQVKCAWLAEAIGLADKVRALQVELAGKDQEIGVLDHYSSEVADLRAKLLAIEGELNERTVEAAKVAERHAGDIADYERTVADQRAALVKLRADLDAEQARRASYQAVVAAARRFVASVEVPGTSPTPGAWVDLIRAVEDSNERA